MAFGAVLVLAIGLVWFFSSRRTEPDTKKPAPEIADVDQKPISNEPPPMPPHIRAALDKGVVHLKKRMEKVGEIAPIDGRFPKDAHTGTIALVGLALLEAKVPRDDPAIQAALRVVRESGPSNQMIYSLGAILFFLNRLHDAEPLQAEDRVLARTLALRIIAGQCEDGRWSYLNPPVTPAQEEKLLEKLQSNKYKPTGIGRPHPPSNSMTQFALLSLWGSSQHGIPVRPAILAAARTFCQKQNADGTWGYDMPGHYSGSTLRDANTCAGLIALAMDKTLREDRSFGGNTVGDPPADALADERCAKAFAHLAGVIGRTITNVPNPDPAVGHRGGIIRAEAWGDYYFLWSLERVAVIYDLKTIDGKDWYGWGSDVILKNQRPDGSWLDRHGDVPDTCFAMLFLARANLAKDLTRSIVRMRDGRAITP